VGVSKGKAKSGEMDRTELNIRLKKGGHSSIFKIPGQPSVIPIEPTLYSQYLSAMVIKSGLRG
jgi:hypothetical protein